METPRNSDNYDISIHALHEESDTWDKVWKQFFSAFQSTLSMRRATQSAQMSSDLTLFQSTLSMRRATWNFIIGARGLGNFNPRSP